MMDMTQSMCDIIYDICGYDKNTIHDVSHGQDYLCRCFMKLENAYVNG